MNELISDAMRIETMGYLEHYGILGMKWGEHNGPPYPISPGDHSASEKRQAKSSVSTLANYVTKRYQVRKQKKQEKKAAKALARETKKAEKIIKAEEKHANNKNEAINSGDAKEVMKWQGELTNQELQYAINRINLSMQLKDWENKQDPAYSKEKFDAKKFIDNISAVGVSVSNLLNSGKKIKDSIEALSNKDEALAIQYQNAMTRGDFKTAKRILSTMSPSKAATMSQQTKNSIDNFSNAQKYKRESERDAKVKTIVSDIVARKDSAADSFSTLDKSTREDVIKMVNDKIAVDSFLSKDTSTISSKGGGGKVELSDKTIGSIVEKVMEAIAAKKDDD